MAPLPALSLWSVWASLIASGAKTLETRTWAPHPDLIGTRMAFAATASLPKEAKDALRHSTPHYQQRLDALRAAGYTVAWDKRRLIHDLPLGQVLCTGVVSGSYPMVDGSGTLPPRCLIVAPRRLLLVRPEGDLDMTSQLPFGVFEPGMTAWHIVDVRPVVGHHPAKGRLGVWTWRPKGPYEAQ